jgi:CheY-like chemotaxis protein
MDMSGRILLVDDDPDLVATLKIAIEAAGHEVVTARNGTEAFERAHESRPDLAIVDVMMDTLSEGVHLTHRFRADADLRNMRIIMLTAVNETIPFNIGKETEEGYLPVDSFLEKPVDPAELLSEIGRQLGS